MTLPFVIRIGTTSDHPYILACWLAKDRERFKWVPPEVYRRAYREECKKHLEHSIVAVVASESDPSYVLGFVVLEKSVVTFRHVGWMGRDDADIMAALEETARAMEAAQK